jgi:cold shock CspA family protein
MNGVVKHWDKERGFGWLRVTNVRDYFCHIKNWLETDAPTVGRAVEFELGPGKSGKPEQAINARYANADAGVAALASTKFEQIAGCDVVVRTVVGRE